MHLVIFLYFVYLDQLHSYLPLNIVGLYHKLQTHNIAYPNSLQAHFLPIPIFVLLYKEEIDLRS